MIILLNKMKCLQIEIYDISTCKEEKQRKEEEIKEKIRRILTKKNNVILNMNNLIKNNELFQKSLKYAHLNIDNGLGDELVGILGDELVEIINVLADEIRKELGTKIRVFSLLNKTKTGYQIYM